MTLSPYGTEHGGLTMLRTLTTILLTILIWGGAALTAVAINARTNVLWSAQGGFLLVAALVLTAWTATHLLLEGARRNPPYHP